MKNLLCALITTFALATQISPALAVDADSAVKTCKKNGNCKITIASNGETTILVNGEVISCPVVGECQCLTCQPPKKSIKSGSQKSIISIPELMQQGSAN